MENNSWVFIVAYKKNFIFYSFSFLLCAPPSTPSLSLESKVFFFTSLIVIVIVCNPLICFMVLHVMWNTSLFWKSPSLPFFYICISTWTFLAQSMSNASPCIMHKLSTCKQEVIITMYGRWWNAILIIFSMILHLLFSIPTTLSITIQVLDCVKFQWAYSQNNPFFSPLNGE